MSEQARGQKGSRWQRERRRQIWRKTETRRRRSTGGRDQGNPIMIWGHSVPTGLPALRVFGIGPEIRARTEVWIRPGSGPGVGMGVEPS